MIEPWIPYLRRIYLQAAGTSEEDVVGAKLGTALAQAGAIDEARQLAVRIREKSHSCRSVAASIYLLLLDGVILYFSNREIASLDKVSRARLLASAVGDIGLEAEVCAWQALISFNFDEYSSLKYAVTFSLVNYQHLHPSLRARVSGTVADILQISNFVESASRWRSVARELSRQVTDRSMLAALEFNRLASALTRFRYDEIIGSSTTETPNLHWSTEFDSISSLQVGFGNAALASLLTVCDARRRHACGDDLGASKLLRELRDRGDGDMSGSTPIALDAEIAWYEVLGGKPDHELLARVCNPRNIDLSKIRDQIDYIFFLTSIASKISIQLDSNYLNRLLAEAVQSLNTHLSQLESVATQIECVCSAPENLLSRHCRRDTSS